MVDWIHEISLILFLSILNFIFIFIFIYVLDSAFKLVDDHFFISSDVKYVVRHIVVCFDGAMAFRVQLFRVSWSFGQAVNLDRFNTISNALIMQNKLHLGSFL